MQTRIRWSFQEEIAFAKAVAASVVRRNAEPDVALCQRLASLHSTEYRKRVLSKVAAELFLAKTKNMLTQIIAETRSQEHVAVTDTTGGLNTATVRERLSYYMELEKKALAQTGSSLEDCVARLSKTPKARASVASLLSTSPLTSTSTPVAQSTQKVKLRVAIAGIHNKWWASVEHSFPHLNIAWISSHDNDSQIKAKASGRPCLACTHGANSKVLHLLRNIAKAGAYYQGNGLAFVNSTLTSTSF